MDDLKNKRAHIELEIARILGNDTESLKKVFSLRGELGAVNLELHWMESSMRRAYMLEMLEQRLVSDRALRLTVQRLQHEFRTRQLKELQESRESLWIYYLIIIEMKILETQYHNTSVRSLEPKPKDSL
ncbi:hypothetical protein [Vibrio coralliilyticus]|uniref:hypothetical protein n=1 Tax=Vibrio coralliilyticus TaxID=190893 RepID=UPI0018378596|nr:hypothetical protein [Vibrio coralliilyticus]NUW66832.1 hypothetical protein [Vibrio coralliilyticus]